MAHFDEKQRVVVAWVPKLSEEAPNIHSPLVHNLYKSRDDCLKHPHWPQHKPYAGAYSVEVNDSGSAEDKAVVMLALAWLVEGEPRDTEERLVLRYLRLGRYASALSQAWSSGLAG